MSTRSPLSAALWYGGRSVADPHLSPDGKCVAFVTTGPEHAELALVDLRGGAEEWVALDPPIKRSSPSSGGTFDWFPDGSGVVYIGADGCLWRHDFSTVTSTALTRGDDSPSGLNISPDGYEVAYVADLAEIVVVPTGQKGAPPRRLSSGADFVVDPTWSPNGKWLGWHEWDDPHMSWDFSWIAVRDAGGKGPVKRIAGGDHVAVGQPRFSPDGSQLTYLCDESGWLNLWVCDVPAFTGARPFFPDNHEHAEPTWGSGQRSYAWSGKRAVVARNVAGRGQLCEVAEEGTSPRVLLNETVVALHAIHGKITGVASSATSGPSVVVFDLASAKTTVVARGPYRAVENAGTEPLDVSWTSGGFDIPARLCRPAETSGPTPLLVWIHGGPTSQSAVTPNPRATYFVERGWSVLVPDYRGTTGWGRAHREALRGQWGQADVADVAAGMRAAVERGWAVPSQIVPLGGSAGGLTTLLLLAHFSELCAAGVAVYPVADLVDLAATTWRLEAHYNDALVGPLPEAEAEYVRRSPVTWVDKIDKPLLLLHGDSDVVVPPSQSERIAAAISRNGGAVEHHVYEGEGHGWRRLETRIDELRRIESFLRSHVLHVGASTGEIA